VPAGVAPFATDAKTTISVVLLLLLSRRVGRRLRALPSGLVDSRDGDFRSSSFSFGIFRNAWFRDIPEFLSPVGGFLAGGGLQRIRGDELVLGFHGVPSIIIIIIVIIIIIIVIIIIIIIIMHKHINT
jgi:hypothetical protein